MTADPLSVVDAYFAAQLARDFAAMRALLADQGFSYASPIAVFDQADDFVRYSAFSSGIVIDSQVRKVFVDGGDICHFLTYRVQISEKVAIAVAHWARVREGRIVRIEVLFDASLYRDLFPGGASPP